MLKKRESQRESETDRQDLYNEHTFSYKSKGMATSILLSIFPSIDHSSIVNLLLLNNMKVPYYDGINTHILYNILWLIWTGSPQSEHYSTLNPLFLHIVTKWREISFLYKNICSFHYWPHKFSLAVLSWKRSLWIFRRIEMWVSFTSPPNLSLIVPLTTEIYYH